MTYRDEIEFLIDQLGYKNSPYRSEYLSRILDIGRYDSSKSLLKLRAEKRMRNKPVLKKFHSDHLSVTDLSSFTFCPASYSITETYEACKTDNMIYGEKLHGDMYLEKYINNIRTKRLKEAHGAQLDVEKADKFVGRGMYGDLLKSKIIFYGHDKEKKEPFFNEKRTLAGIPDYIFEHSDKSKFVVEEKHTWREEDLTGPFPNHIIQIHGYIHGLKSLNVSYGYILYFHWVNKIVRHRSYLTTSRAQIFQIAKTRSAISELSDTFLKVRSLKEGTVIDFDINQIKLDKCFHCSVRVLCNHKSGRFNAVRYPYYKSQTK